MRHVFVTSSLACLIAATLLASPAGSRTASAASGTTFSGRAFVLGGTVEGIQVGPLFDTGPVAAGGGALEASLLTYPASGLPDPTSGALTAEVLHTSVIAQGDRSDAQAGIFEFQLKAAGQTIGASFLTAQATAVCTNGSATISGSSEIAGLTINGQGITVGTAANQTVPLPPLGQVVINEQVGSARAGDGTFTVNALHITLRDPITGNRTDFIVASAHADIVCGGLTSGCAKQDFVTGGGWIASPSAAGAKANFAVAGGPNGFGHLLYIDHGTGMRVKGTGDIRYTVTGPTSREITGTTDSGTYTADVADNGEPGRGKDTFYLTLSNGYTAGTTLGGGNIQLHCKN